MTTPQEPTSQAVIFIHGVGDQTPRSNYWTPSTGVPPKQDSNETLRHLLGFVADGPNGRYT